VQLNPQRLAYLHVLIASCNPSFTNSRVGTCGFRIAQEAELVDFHIINPKVEIPTTEKVRMGQG